LINGCQGEYDEQKKKWQAQTLLWQRTVFPAFDTYNDYPTYYNPY